MTAAFPAGIVRKQRFTERFWGAKRGNEHCSPPRSKLLPGLRSPPRLVLPARPPRAPQPGAHLAAAVEINKRFQPPRGNKTCPGGWCSRQGEPAARCSPRGFRSTGGCRGTAACGQPRGGCGHGSSGRVIISPHSERCKRQKSRSRPILHL